MSSHRKTCSDLGNVLLWQFNRKECWSAKTVMYSHTFYLYKNNIRLMKWALISLSYMINYTWFGWIGPETIERLCLCKLSSEFRAAMKDNMRVSCYSSLMMRLFHGMARRNTWIILSFHNKSNLRVGWEGVVNLNFRYQTLPMKYHTIFMTPVYTICARKSMNLLPDSILPQPGPKLTVCK